MIVNNKLEVFFRISNIIYKIYIDIRYLLRISYSLFLNNELY